MTKPVELAHEIPNQTKPLCSKPAAIKVQGICLDKKNAVAVSKNIGFQFLCYRHRRGILLATVAKRTGYSMREIDRFELGKDLPMDLFLCLRHFYKSSPELWGEPWEIHICD